MTIEDSVLNNFFEYGFIVTNSDAAISESSAQDERLYKIVLKFEKYLLSCHFLLPKCVYL